jgi:hypothetical protein
MCFTLKRMVRVERHITVGYVLMNGLLMSLKLTNIGSWKSSLNCNIIASRIESFYLNVISMISLVKESD